MLSKLCEKLGLDPVTVFKQPDDQTKSEYTFALTTAKNQIDDYTSALMVYGDEEATKR